MRFTKKKTFLILHGNQSRKSNLIISKSSSFSKSSASLDENSFLSPSERVFFAGAFLLKPFKNIPLSRERLLYWTEEIA